MTHSTIKTIEHIREFFAYWLPPAIHEDERLEVPLPEVEAQYFPSNPRGHVVVGETPIEAWREMLYLMVRFGRRVTLKKGERLELQHVKVVVKAPQFEEEDKLRAVNLDPARLRRYQDDILEQ